MRSSCCCNGQGTNVKCLILQCVGHNLKVFCGQDRIFTVKLGKTQIFGVGRAQLPAVMYSVGKTLVSSVSRAQLSSVTMSKRQLVCL